MEWKDIGNTLAKSLPILGTVLGGPAGGAIGSLVSSALGVSNDAESVNAALSADPAALEKLKELEVNSKVQLQQLAVTAEQNRLAAANQQFQLEAGDRDSARKLAATQKGDWIRPSLAVLLLVAIFGILIAVFGGFADSILKDTTAAVTVGTLIGYLFNEFKSVMAFYFGTTRDSQQQNNTITSFAVAPGTVSFDANHKDGAK